MGRRIISENNVKKDYNFNITNTNIKNYSNNLTNNNVKNNNNNGNDPLRLHRRQVMC